MHRATLSYTPFYCEENIWHLCQHEGLRDHQREVMVISNPAQRCPLWFQRAVPPTCPVIWDYHVVLASRPCAGAPALIWDLDTRLSFPMAAVDYLDATFMGEDQWQARYKPCFRVVDATVYVAHFTSDRSHMRESGVWLKPPPTWPAIGLGRPGTLASLIDMTSTEEPWSTSPVDLQSLRQHLGAHA